MTTIKSWESPGAPVEGYIVSPGESLESPTFPTARGLAWTSSTGGLIAVEEAVLDPGESGPYRHYHTNVTELFYVLEGEFLLQIGEQVTRARPGTFAFCPIGCVHAFRAAGTGRGRMLIMAMPPGIAEGAFRELHKLPSGAGEAEWEIWGKKWGNIVVGPPLDGD